MKNVALVLAGLTLGVLAGVTLVPRVLAQGAASQAAPMKWQQFCEPVASIPEASGIAGARGAEGWELVTYTAGVMCFKRPALGANAAAPALLSAPPPQAAPKPPSGDRNWPGY